MERTIRVLVVDDDHSTRELIGLILADEGYVVSTVSRSQAALQLAETTAPDLILLDLRLPTMDGWDFVRACRASAGCEASIVVVSAAPDVESRAVHMGAEGWLAKPFNIADLIEMVSKYAAPDRKARHRRLR